MLKDLMQNDQSQQLFWHRNFENASLFILQVIWHFLFLHIGNINDSSNDNITKNNNNNN